MKKFKKKLTLEIFRLTLFLEMFDLYYEAKKKGEISEIIDDLKRAIDGLQKKINLNEIDLYKSNEKGKIRNAIQSLRTHFERAIDVEYQGIDTETEKNEIKKQLAIAKHQYFKKVDEVIKNENNKRILKNNLSILKTMEDFK
jgi:hypothetical protein